MQPHDPYNNPDHGGQHPSGPYPPQGGAHPSGGYAQPSGYGQSGGYPPPYGQPGGMPPGPPPAGPAATDPASAKMPGTVITVRVFMFLGGIPGLLLGGILLVAGFFFSDHPDVLAATEDSLLIPSGTLTPDDAAMLLLGAGLIPAVYGLISTLLASFLGKRNGFVLWTTVVFQSLAALWLVISLVTSPAAFVPLAFTVLIIGLMVGSKSRAFYKPVPPGPVPQGPVPHGYGPQY